MYPNPYQSKFSTITEMVTQRILQEQANLANHEMQDIYELPPATFPPPASSVATPPPATEAVTPVSEKLVLTEQFSAMANSMQLREQDLQTLEQQMLTQMQEMMSRMLSQNYNPPPTGGNLNRGHQRQPGHGGRTPTYGYSNTSGRSTSPQKYCWSHGACAHTGAECNTPATGHQTLATFANMMNGSTNNCYWLPST